MSIKKLDQSHIDLLKTCPLPKKPSYAIGFVTETQFSIARHYGGAKVQGKDYTYLPEGDQLVRDDVLKWLQKQKSNKTETTVVNDQKDLFES